MAYGFYLVVFAAVIYNFSSSSESWALREAEGGARDGTVECPCENVTHCDPITASFRREALGFVTNKAQ